MFKTLEAPAAKISWAGGDAELLRAGHREAVPLQPQHPALQKEQSGGEAQAEHGVYHRAHDQYGIVEGQNLEF